MFFEKCGNLGEIMMSSLDLHLRVLTVSANFGYLYAFRGRIRM
jgi:hypothetical protein